MNTKTQVPTPMLPRLSAGMLEQKAQIFLNNNSECPNLKNKDFLELDHLITHLSQTQALNYQVTNLGHHNGNKVLGVMIGKENKIAIDQILETKPDIKRFTQAHEIGHWVLHKELNLENFSDSELTLNQNQIPSTPLDWIEWQANNFAACLLMPTQSILDAIQQKIKLLKIQTKTDDKKEIIRPHEYLKLIQSLQFQFGVSKTALALRIKKCIPSLVCFEY